MKVIFFGTPSFAAEVLKSLLQAGINVVAVVTKPDRALGRSSKLVPTPVKSVALAHSPPLPVFQPEIVSALAFAPTLEQYQADLFVVVAYGEIIKQHLLDMPKMACINLHASLLPKYRGAAPIQRCLIEGEKESGVTIIHMVKKMDAGDMIGEKKVPIGPNTTYGDLEGQLCQAGIELLLEVLQLFAKGTPQRFPQDSALVTFAPKIELEDCQVDWQQPAEVIHNLVRGVTPHPGAWCLIELRGETKRLKIVETRLTASIASLPVGAIINVRREGLEVACGRGSLLVTQVQLEGKKALSAYDFAQGIPYGSMKFGSQ